MLEIAYPLEWVKLSKYCELAGDTVDAVKAKIKRGLWAEEKHYRKAADGRIYINLVEANLWIAKSKPLGG
jgi:hypothetical protein